MHAALILPGDSKWPNGPLLSAVEGGVDRLYYEAYDPQVDVAFLQQLRAWGFEAGLDMDPRWNGYSKDPEWYALEMKRLRSALARTTDGKQAPCPVMFDIEAHDPNWVLRCLSKWRSLYPGVNTIWTFESMQGGWIDDVSELVAFINDYPQLQVLPQYYQGNMRPIAGDAAMRDLLAAGLELEQIEGFYGLRDENRKPVRIPSGWSGCLYVENWSILAAAL